jgi:hypothetical protein
VALTLTARSGARPKRGLGLVRKPDLIMLPLPLKYIILACNVASLRPINETAYEVWLWCQHGEHFGL